MSYYIVEEVVTIAGAPVFDGATQTSRVPLRK